MNCIDLERKIYEIHAKTNPLQFEKKWTQIYMEKEPCPWYHLVLILLL